MRGRGLRAIYVEITNYCTACLGNALGAFNLSCAPNLLPHFVKTPVAEHTSLLPLLQRFRTLCAVYSCAVPCLALPPEGHRVFANSETGTEPRYLATVLEFPNARLHRPATGPDLQVLFEYNPCALHWTTSTWRTRRNPNLAVAGGGLRRCYSPRAESPGSRLRRDCRPRERYGTSSRVPGFGLLVLIMATVIFMWRGLRGTAEEMQR